MYKSIKNSAVSHTENTISENNVTKTNISIDINKNKEYLKASFSNCFDLILRETSFFNIGEKKALVVYFEGFIDKKLIEDALISKLTSKLNNGDVNLDNAALLKNKLGIKNQGVHSTIEEAIEAILSGNPIIFADNLDKAFEIDLNSPPGRSIEEPAAEVVSRGPREGFTESLSKNICLLRKKIKNHNLKTEKFKIGKETNTNVAISYLSNIADKKIVEEVKKRLNNIDINSILDSNYIAEYISDETYSIFPTIFHTEKPDVAASKILEGRIIIIVDGSPVVLSVPCLFIEFLQSGEDYYLKYSSATLNRFVRYFSLLITITLPSLYVSLVAFNQELIPTKLAITIASSRASVPFSSLLESFFMLATFEIMREAGIRIPKSLGPSISIVGGLVLGDAAVRAGLVGTPMIVVVSLTAISKFTISSIELEQPIVYVRFFFMFLSGSLGLIGLACGLSMVSIRLSSMRSFGIPYMFPLFPFNTNTLEDTIVRLPRQKLSKTQRLLNLKDNFISNRIHKHSKP